MPTTAGPPQLHQMQLEVNVAVLNVLLTFACD